MISIRRILKQTSCNHLESSSKTHFLRDVPNVLPEDLLPLFGWKKVSVWNFGGKTLYVGILEDLFYLIWELYRIELGFAGFWGNRKFQR